MQITLETVGALAVAPEQPDVVVLQLDIFTSLLQGAFSRNGAVETSSHADHDDTLDVDVNVLTASFLKTDAVDNLKETVEGEAIDVDVTCSRALDLFEEIIGSIVLMGDTVFLDVPHMEIMYNIVEQVSPLCLPSVQARYSNIKELVAAVAASVMVSKQAAQHLCGSHTHNSREMDEEKCLHLEVKAVEPPHNLHSDDDSTSIKSSGSSIYRFKLMYYSQFDFKLLQNVTLVRNVKELKKQSTNNTIADSIFDQQLPSVQFSVSLKELKSRLRQVKHENKELSLGSKAQQEGVSVYTLLHLGVEPTVKRLLFKQYIDFPFVFLNEADQHNLSPWKMFAKVSLNLNAAKHVQEVQLDYLPGDAEEVPVAGGKYQHQQEENRIRTHVGVSSNNKNVKNELQTAQFYVEALQHELESHRGDLAQHGHFSFVEHNSEYGFISAQIAQQYVNASVVSLERDSGKMKQHVRMLDALKIENNVVCSKGADSDSTIFQRIYESPELFRYQLVARGLLESFANTEDTAAWGSDLGCLLSSALTTFLAVPSSRQVSLAMNLFFQDQASALGQSEVVDLRGPYRPLSAVFTFSSETVLSEKHSSLAFWEDVSSIKNHPLGRYQGFETLWLLGLTKAHQGSTELSFTPVYHPSSNSVPLFIRCDLHNMTRHVHHHYDYAKDGHSRTYTMRVEVNHTITAAASAHIGDPSTSVVGRLNESDVLLGAAESTYTLPLGMHPNQHQIVSVNLLRDKDSFPIPYTSIYGITLISILRLGIDSTIRDRLFKSFLFLPLYEDMAPWNIVLMGKEMAYIDYDTRDMTFDLDIPKAYQVISVLMNYKRTVEDFKRCGKKSNTVYGLAFISDCVGEQRFGSKAISCPNLKLPVPCGDGTCHSDYISCLRAYSDRADALAAEVGASGTPVGAGSGGGGAGDGSDKLSLELAEAMRSGIGMFSS